MGRTIPLAFFVSLLLLWVGRPGYAFDLGQELKKAIEQNPQPQTAPGRPPSSAGGGVDLGGVRGLLGFSPGEEVPLGRKAAGTLFGAAPLVKDAKLQ